MTVSQLRQLLASHPDDAIVTVDDKDYCMTIRDIRSPLNDDNIVIIHTTNSYIAEIVVDSSLIEHNRGYFPNR